MNVSQKKAQIILEEINMNYKNEDGFSLLEVALAVGIMALLTALALPTFSNIIPSVQTKANLQETRNCTIENKLDDVATAAGNPATTPQDCTTP